MMGVWASPIRKVNWPDWRISSNEGAMFGVVAIVRLLLEMGVWYSTKDSGEKVSHDTYP